jgi:hypothetical protein
MDVFGIRGNVKVSTIYNYIGTTASNKRQALYGWMDGWQKQPYIPKN